mgnify:CR=1 FL=1
MPQVLPVQLKKNIRRNSHQGMIPTIDFIEEAIVIRELELDINRAGLHEITHQLNQMVGDSGIDEGLCTIFIRHTSASLTIQENADPSCQRDLEQWLNRLVSRGDEIYTHTSEGEDDMPAHIKSMLTQTSVGIPVISGHLVLGTWQGIFLWEHRQSSHRRKLVIHLG